MSKSQNGIAQLLEVLPPVVRERLNRSPDLDSLIEVVLDYGRPAEARFMHRVDRWHNLTISEHDLDYVVKSIGEFGEDNRAGIERTLHRISAIRNRHGKVVGLTCRVGRALEGTIDIIDDLVRSGQSILMLGRPGVGKTTKLREVARVLADEVGRRVVIVDTSNEIGGDGDVPHPAIGSARRMQVRNPGQQHAVMIEAVENHMPEVIVIDEIGNEAEAYAARTIAERGVQLIATAHGQTLENLMLNPSLCDLVGGIQAVTLSDDEARRRGTTKTVLERKAPPTFGAIIELLDFEKLAVHHNTQRTVDLMLRGVAPRPEVRVRTDVGAVEIVQPQDDLQIDEAGFDERFPSLARRPAEPRRPRGERGDSERDADRVAERPTVHPRESRPRDQLRVYPYGIARTRLDRAIREKKANVVVTNDIRQADAVIAIRSTYQGKAGRLRDVEKKLPTVVVKSNTFSQIAGALDEIVNSRAGDDETERAALDECQAACQTVLQGGKPIELAPRDGRTRRLQHQMAESKKLFSESVGQEPQRRLRILPVRLT